MDVKVAIRALVENVCGDYRRSSCSGELLIARLGIFYIRYIKDSIVVNKKETNNNCKRVMILSIKHL